MNVMKFCLAMLIGVLFTGVTLAVAGYCLSLSKASSRGGNFISFSNPEYLIAIVGVVLGVIIGGISGATIFGFQLSFLRAVLFGLVFNLFISVVLFVWTEGDADVLPIFIVLILVGMANGAIVSLLNTGQKSTE